jgi:hypothetical protein
MILLEKGSNTQSRCGAGFTLKIQLNQFQITPRLQEFTHNSVRFCQVSLNNMHPAAILHHEKPIKK